MNLETNIDFTLKVLEEIVTIPSPTGYCKNVMQHIEKIAGGFGYNVSKNKKGNRIIEIEGVDNDYCIGIPVHVDTLGAMVRSINSDGTLKITTIGGNIFSTLDGEYCKIHTRSGKIYTGTMLSTSPSVHVYSDARDKARTEENMMVRLDEKVKNKDEVLKLEIGVGDFISIEPKFTVTPSGYVKSRYLDDKAGTACALSLLEMFNRLGTKPKNKVKIIAHELCQRSRAAQTQDIYVFCIKNFFNDSIEYFVIRFFYGISNIMHICFQYIFKHHGLIHICR
jgi:putative aminopeptidase FrvX